jgi:hypothetical protein
VSGRPGDAVQRTGRLSGDELEELERARSLLESGGLVVRVAAAVGRPLEAGLARLPTRARQSVQGVTRVALERALGLALETLRRRSRRSSERLHKAAAAASGAAGGFFGLGGLAVELPVTTVVMLRSIAQIARDEGQDITLPETRLACLEVFALGAGGEREDAAETGYYAVRATLSRALSEAARHVARHGVSRKGAPALVRVVTAIAARFGIVVEQKVALASVPLLGAVTASLVNTVFIDHFQKRARGHFRVRRLEAEHGHDVVRAAYEALGRTSHRSPG